MSKHKAGKCKRCWRDFVDGQKWRCEDCNELARVAAAKSYAADPDLHRQRSRDFGRKLAAQPIVLGPGLPILDRRRELQTRKRYKMTLEEVAVLAETQDYVCAVCGAAFASSRDMCIDHCHRSGKVRGLLCGNCNQGLGKFKDDPVRIRSAIDYLAKHKP